MGKSRSTTVLIAYLLSIHPNPTLSTVQDILDTIRQARSIAEPNSGFMKQLSLYARMGCPDDVHGHPVYQRWLYEQEVMSSIETRQAPSNVFFADEAKKGEHADSESDFDTEWKCRKCRRFLARKEFEAEHTPKALTSDGQTSQRNAKSSSFADGSSPSVGQPDSQMDPISSFEIRAGASQTLQPCAHIFLYPLSWMREELEAGKLNGRLECPNSKCKANVGKYAWQGLRCSCDEWVVPGIALARGRVDERKVKRGGGVGLSKRGDGALEGKVGGLKI